MICSRRIAVTRAAARKLRDAFEQADSQFETGGVLLGYRILKRWLVMDATVPDGTEPKERFEFMLDGDAAAEAAALLVHKHWPPLSFLGVWHSHPGINDEFSKQDRESNRQLACSLNGALSALISETETQQLKTDFYHISPDGSEALYLTILKRKGIY